MKTEQWYQEEDDRIAKALDGYVAAVRRRTSWWERRLALYLMLYGGDRYGSGAGTRPTGRQQGSAGRPQLTADPARPGLKLNIVGPIVDAAANRICEGRPRAVFSTKRGDWKLQRLAKERTKLLEGIFQQGRFFKVRQRAAKAAAVCGNGWGMPVWEDGRIEYDYVFPGEVVVDDFEGQSDKPRSIVRERLVDREVLIKRYPRMRAELEKAGTGDVSFGRDSNIDQILLREAWHLPSAPGANDGVFLRATTNAKLAKKSLERARYPLTPWVWGDPLAGFRGEGIIERIMGIQREINSVLRTIAANVYAGGNLKVAVQRGSNIIQAQLSNALGGVRIDYDNVPPQFFASDVFSPQLLQYLQALVDMAYRVARQSELSASSEIPAGLSGSGRSMLVYQSIDAKNFISVGRNDEDATLDMALRTLDLAADMKADFEVTYRAKSWLERYSAKDLLKRPDDFEIQIHSASWMGATTAGRVALAEELRQSGYWSKEVAAKHADIPTDPESELDLESAPVDLIDQRIEAILGEGRALSPHPRMNLKLYIRRASLAYQRAEVRGYPKERLTMLGKTIDLAIRLDKQGQGLQDPAAASMGGGPMPGPGAPPQPQAA